MPIRKIKKVIKSKPTIEGAGVHIKRAFGYHNVPEFDPFLLFDDFHSNNPDHYRKGFPWHPHRGIETITYVLNGDVEHGDSMSNKGHIREGDVQWMTAGSGIIHQEMPVGDEQGVLWGFQLWANLPASMKMIPPAYQGYIAEQIPHITLDNKINIKIICGEVNGIKGPVENVAINPQYLDISIPKETDFSYNVNKGDTVFAYIIDGEGYFEKERDAYSYEREGENYFDYDRDSLLSGETIVLFDDGDEIFVSAKEGGLRFLLISGKPLKEPIAWGGPIVMNTKDELRKAFEEFHNDAFLKYQSSE
jgi:hypothetical protein